MKKIFRKYLAIITSVMLVNTSALNASEYIIAFEKSELELTPDQFKQLQTRLTYVDYAITICKVYLTKI